MNRTMIFQPDDGLSNISVQIGTAEDKPNTAYLTVMTGRGVVARLVIDRTNGRTNHFMLIEDDNDKKAGTDDSEPQHVHEQPGHNANQQSHLENDASAPFSNGSGCCEGCEPSHKRPL